MRQGSRLPVGPGLPGQLLRGNYALHLSIYQHADQAAVAGQGLQGSGGGGRQFARQGRRSRGHCIRYPVGFQRFPQGFLPVAAGRHIEQETADQSEPDALKIAQSEPPHKARANHQQSQALAGPDGRLGGPPVAAAEAPNHRPQYPAAIQGKTGQQVENPQGQVDGKEGEQHGPQVGTGSVAPVPQAAEQRRQQQAGQGADYGYQKLGPGPLGFVGQLGNAAKDEQGYASHRYAPAYRHQAVGKFVGQYRQKE